LAVLQQGLPATETPYADMAQRIGIDVSDLLQVLRRWKEQGKLRRIGAIVNHFQIDLAAGAMVLWQVPTARVEEVGRKLAGFVEVSHAYERHSCRQWPYNVYTMVHAATPEKVQQTVKRMSSACAIDEYRVLLTEKELKKVPPTYIMVSED